MRAAYPVVPFDPTNSWGGGWQFVEFNHSVTLYEHRAGRTTCTRFKFDEAVAAWTIDTDGAHKPGDLIAEEGFTTRCYALVTLVGLPTSAPLHPTIQSLRLPANRRDLLFRVTREDESWRHGLVAKAPQKTYAIHYHSSGTRKRTQCISFMSAALAGWSCDTMFKSLNQWICDGIERENHQRDAYTIVVVEASAVSMPVVIAADAVNNERTRTLTIKWHEKIVDVFVPASAIRAAMSCSSAKHLRFELERLWAAEVGR